MIACFSLHLVRQWAFCYFFAAANSKFQKRSFTAIFIRLSFGLCPCVSIFKISWCCTSYDNLSSCKAYCFPSTLSNRELMRLTVPSVAFIIKSFTRSWSLISIQIRNKANVNVCTAIGEAVTDGSFYLMRCVQINESTYLLSLVFNRIGYCGSCIKTKRAFLIIFSSMV